MGTLMTPTTEATQTEHKVHYTLKESYRTKKEEDTITPNKEGGFFTSLQRTNGLQRRISLLILW